MNDHPDWRSCAASIYVDYSVERVDQCLPNALIAIRDDVEALRQALPP